LVVSVGAASAVAIVAALRIGANAPHETRTTEAPSTPALAPPTEQQPLAADNRHDRSRDEREPPALPAGNPGAPAVRPVEPARVVSERPSPATSTVTSAPLHAAPPASRARSAAAPPLGVAPAPAAAAPSAATPTGTGGDFDQGAARVALAMAASQASGCKQPDDPSGGAKVSVTFAPSGRAMSAQVVGGAFQGTRTGACIARAFHAVTVPPFSGDPVTVTKSVTVR
jgi:hypothetical protein